MSAPMLLIILLALGGCRSYQSDFKPRTASATESARTSAGSPKLEPAAEPREVPPIPVATANPQPTVPTFEDFKESTALATALTLADPLAWRVFQRQTRLDGTLSFTTAEAISSVRFVRSRILKNNQMVGQAWETFETPVGLAAMSRFSFKVPAGGWYTLEVITYNEKKQILSRTEVDRIGMGEVFLVSGQSNSSNCGAPAQKSASGMVSSTNGSLWKQGNDPQIGTADAYIPFCQNGSNWPRTGDRLAEKYQVPIAFASTGHSGTEVAHWIPGATNPHAGLGAPPILYDYLKIRSQQLGKDGFRAVLWHQGENDTVTSPPTTSNQYFQRMTTIMKQLETDVGMPNLRWAVAQASWCKDGTYPQVNNGFWGESAAVRDAQSRLWLSEKVFPGPDTDQLKDDIYRRLVSNNSRDCHFSAMGLQTVGDMWFESISKMLDQIVK